MAVTPSAGSIATEAPRHREKGKRKKVKGKGRKA